MGLQLHQTFLDAERRKSSFGVRIPTVFHGFSDQADPLLVHQITLQNRPYFVPRHQVLHLLKRWVKAYKNIARYNIACEEWATHKVA